MDDPTNPRPDDSPSEGNDPTVRDSIERVDTQIGPYRLLELLGEGAMGEVWRAEQREPIKRIVALKIIKRGMDTREVVTRFEIERQAMALMDHPWIAKVYDAGATESGRPYIAIEYIAGEKLTDYCSRNKLSIEERLKLFQKVCQAIQHAHQKAVIHRDLKPSNIMVVEVDGEPVPKVIDFGIAKATAQRLTDRSAATFVGQLIGTPLYMSPEQVEMSAAGVDTRADVYSLGVILYEMLSGALPHDPQKLARAAFDEVLKMLREEEPDRPSTKISTLGDKTAEIAAQRGLDPKKLAGKLKGDLDWITLKALEKDRKRRYETPQHLVEDIERFLRLEAIEARPPSKIYQLSRFTSRHRSAVVLTAVVLVALVGFAVWQTHQSQVIARARDKAMANERLSLAREQLSKDPTLAMAYSISSLEVLDQEPARAVLREAFAAGRIRDEIPRGDARGNPLGVDASLDGRFLAVTWQSEDGSPTVGIHDLETGSLRQVHGPGVGFTFMVTLTSDASHVAAIAQNGLHLWRLVDGKHLLHEFTSAPDGTKNIITMEDPTKLAVTFAPNEGRTRWYELDVSEARLTPLGESMGGQSDSVPFHSAAIDASGTTILDYDDRRVFLQRVDELESGRVLEVGRHDADIESVGCSPDGAIGASVDSEGVVKVWDLRARPPRMVRRFQQTDTAAGGSWIRFDPHRPRFCIVSMGPHLEVFDLEDAPNRAPVVLLDRSHWTHDGTFLPDGSIITARNGIRSGPLAWWRHSSPVQWIADVGDSLGFANIPIPSADGSAVYCWMESGAIIRIPVSGRGPGAHTVLGITTSPNTGMTNTFFMSQDERRFLTYNAGQGGARLLDLDRGQTRVVNPFQNENAVFAFSPSGRRACTMDLPEGIGDDLAVSVVDLDELRIEAVFNRGGSSFRGAEFVSEDSLLYFTSKFALVVDLAHEPASVDTLWRAPGRITGSLGSGWQVIMLGDGGERTIVDVSTGESTDLVWYGGKPAMAGVFSEPLGLMARSVYQGSLEVEELNSGRTWHLPQANVGADLAFDPRGRCLYESRPKLRAWSLPLDPIFSDLPSNEFLQRARELTNVRVIPDPQGPQGFRVTNAADSGF